MELEILENRSSTIARDLRINLQRVLSEGVLEPSEAMLGLLATATSADMPSLVKFAQSQLRTLNFTEDEIREAGESAAIMAMLNTYYSFRFIIREQPGAEENYRNTELRMTALARPNLGKVRFEMLAFAVSVLNGCESCICSHEKVLRDSGVDVAKIHQLARLAAIVHGCKTLSRIDQRENEVVTA